MESLNDIVKVLECNSMSMAQIIKYTGLTPYTVKKILICVCDYELMSKYSNRDYRVSYMYKRTRKGDRFLTTMEVKNERIKDSATQ